MYENEWHLFYIHAKTFNEAAAMGGEMGLWLHAWDWVETDTDTVYATLQRPRW